jgi:hypothetical protein
MLWKGFQRPNRLEIDEEKGNYGKFTAQPLERGWGTSIGNALRRVLLRPSKARFTAVKIKGVEHNSRRCPAWSRTSPTSSSTSSRRIGCTATARARSSSIPGQGSSADAFDDGAQVEILNAGAPIANARRRRPAAPRGDGEQRTQLRSRRRNFDPEAPIDVPGLGSLPGAA